MFDLIESQMNNSSNSIRKMFEGLGIAFTKTGTLKELVLKQRELERAERFHHFLTCLNPALIKPALRMLPNSKSENFQDIFALLLAGERKDCFFVEFGATDGVQGSNSYMMEKIYGWTGILAEPARCWHASLHKNRNVKISHQCVWRESGISLAFRETKDAGLSTLDALAEQDRHAKRRLAAGVYQVETVSLPRLLNEHNAPKIIDYLSIDTEGSEYEIISALDFEKHRPLVITIEHNYRPDRLSIAELLKGHGYAQAPAEVSLFDDWFVCHSIESSMHQLFSLDLAANDV
jgi:FkbM family methyltransferase